MRPFCFCFKTSFHRANPLGFVCFAEVHVGLILAGRCAWDCLWTAECCIRSCLWTTECCI